MKQMRKMIFFVVLLGILLMSGCMQPEVQKPVAPVTKVVKISELKSCTIEDYTTYGLWSLTFEKSELMTKGMTAGNLVLKTSETSTETFDIEGHKVNHDLYICFIPEHISKNEIETGIVVNSGSRGVQTRDGLGIEKVIIQGEEVLNETNTYEMTLLDYIELKANNTSRIYSNSKLIRPTWIKSSEENAYTMQRYHNARQVADEKSAQGALTYLKDRSVEAHNELLYFGNANRLSLTDEGAEVIEKPDTRKRLRESGTEGNDAGYYFETQGENVEFRIWSQHLTNEEWHEAESFTLDIRDVNEDCELLPGAGSVYAGSVAWTLNDELARNARVTAKTDFAGGEGTKEEPYLIANWKHLHNVRDYMAEGVYFTQIKDLSSQTEYYDTYVATETTPDNKGWEPLGQLNDEWFKGIFNGCDENNVMHTISDLCIDRAGENYIGLFGLIGRMATVTNVALEDVRITGGLVVGAMAGCNNGNIIKSHVSGKVAGQESVGGFVGRNSIGTVTTSYTTAEVSGNDSVGGFTGENNKGIITESYSLGKVTGQDSTGGFIGKNMSIITDAYATGDVFGSSRVGGFVGLYVDKEGCDDQLKNVYSAGKVTGDGGGFAGEIVVQPVVVSAFWDTITSGHTTGVYIGSSSGITGKPTIEMKQKETFTTAGWDFDNVWIIVEDGDNCSYPYLKKSTQNPAPGFGEKDFAAGDGTEAQPYQIANWKQLDNVKRYMGEEVHFVLTTDLASNTAYYEDYVAKDTTADNKGWEPIGTNTEPFTGIFNGFDGSATHTISDLYIDRPEEDYIGLFGYTSNKATITNLGLENVDITGKSCVGGFVGWNAGVVTNAHTTGKVIGKGDEVGGFVGDNCNGSVKNAYSTAVVTGEGNYVGGFAGKMNDGELTNVYATGEVTGSGNEIGGLVGRKQSGVITHAYATGDVTGANCVGGLVGTNANDITHAYSTGKVTGTGSDVGGFIGTTSGGTMNACFWDTTTSETTTGVGSGDTTGITGKTTDEMKNKDTYTGWDFDGDWDIGDGNLNVSYPWLKSVPVETVPGLIEKIFAGGDGTSGNPYQIAGWRQLDNVRDYMAADVYFVLITDLSSQTEGYETYASTGTENPEGWEAIGTEPRGGFGNPFKGVFNGYDGSATHTISDLCIDRESDDDIGLFGWIDTAGTVKNLFVEDFSVKADERVGGLTGVNQGRIERVFVTGNLFADSHVGGLAGKSENGSVQTCSASVVVHAESQIGGLVGYHKNNRIETSYATAVIVATNYTAGGLVGGGYGGSITDCHASVLATGTANYIGGFIGEGGNSLEIINANASGTVYGGSYVGGFIGLAREVTINESCATGTVIGNTSSTCAAGGFVGYINSDTSTTMATCCFNGTVRGGRAGGFAGDISMGHTTITNAHAIADVTGSSHTGGFAGSINKIVNSSTSAQITTASASGTVTGGEMTGGFAGYIGRGATIEMAFATGTVTGDDNTGGFTGENCGEITTASANGTVTGTGDETGGFAGRNNEYGDIATATFIGTVTGVSETGGFVGENYGDITNANASGTVTGTDDYTGGFAGEVYNGTIEKSRTTGDVTGTNYVGGFVGRHYNGLIQYAYSSGNVSGVYNIGGFAGILSDSIRTVYSLGDVSGTDAIGGLIGSVSGGDAFKAYSAGRITATGSYVGGIAGANNTGTSLNACFWDKTLTAPLMNNVGVGYEGPSKGKTTAEMKDSDTFTAATWEFGADKPWLIVSEGGQKSYPYLREVPQNPAPGLE